MLPVKISRPGSLPGAKADLQGGMSCGDLSKGAGGVRSGLPHTGNCLCSKPTAVFTSQALRAPVQSEERKGAPGEEPRSPGQVSGSLRPCLSACLEVVCRSGCVSWSYRHVSQGPQEGWGDRVRCHRVPWAQARAGPVAAMGVLLTACVGLPWRMCPGTQNGLADLLSTTVCVLPSPNTLFSRCHFD